MGKLSFIFSLPRSLYWNIRVFGLKTGFHMPVIIANCVRIKGVKKGSWELNTKPSFGTVRLGLGNGSYGHGRGRKSNLILTGNGKIFLALVSI